KEHTTSNRVLSATLENLRAMTGRMKLVDHETVSWNAALANYKEHAAVYDFSGAGAAINAVQITDSALKKSQTAMLKKAQWLADWKNKLIVDLTRAHFSGSIADIDGARYNGIVGADPEKLMLKTRYGIVGLPWAKLQPKKLLAVSASFIWPEVTRSKPSRLVSSWNRAGSIVSRLTLIRRKPASQSSSASGARRIPFVV